jgi:copper chaperone CopZ
MTKLEIPVEGMHCEGCASSLQLALQRVEGVRDAKADFPGGRVRLSLDPGQVSEQQVRETIELCGFKPGERAAASSGW